MKIFPAIDLLDKKVVRLFQGDYGKSRVFGDDPADYAKRFYDSGADCLHIVDLDGAKTGTPLNFALVERIAAAVPDMFIEFGGGVRDEAAASRCFDAGVSRVILGTRALRDREFLVRMACAYGDGIAVGVDARNGRAAADGWTSDSGADGVDFCRQAKIGGVRYIIYTDIEKDGAGKGTNLDVYRRLTEIEGVNFTASGGVSLLDEIKKLKDMGLYAAILGRALYTGEIKLEEAIAEAGGN